MSGQSVEILSNDLFSIDDDKEKRYFLWSFGETIQTCWFCSGQIKKVTSFLFHF